MKILLLQISAHSKFPIEHSSTSTETFATLLVLTHCTNVYLKLKSMVWIFYNAAVILKIFYAVTHRFWRAEGPAVILRRFAFDDKAFGTSLRLRGSRKTRLTLFCRSPVKEGRQDRFVLEFPWYDDCVRNDTSDTLCGYAASSSCRNMLNINWNIVNIPDVRFFHN